MGQGPKLQFQGESLSFVRRAIIRIVLADLLKQESGAMAVQHLGILWIIYEYSDSQDPVTTARLKTLTKMTSTAIIRIAERLESLGLIKRRLVTASHGRGRAWEYHPALPDDLLGEAVKGILAAGTPLPPFEVSGERNLPRHDPHVSSASKSKAEPRDQDPSRSTGKLRRKQRNPA